MGLAQLQSWGRAQLLHDRVRLSTSGPADLLRPGVNAVHVRRCSLVHPRRLRQEAERLGVGFRSKVLADTRRPAPAAEELVRALREPEVREWLQADICQLLVLFGPDLLGYRRVSARLEVLGGTPCPRWHADHVGVRCLVTYLGPGTQVVENRHVKRRWLWGGEGGVAVAGVAAEAPHTCAGEGDLLFLKGHAAPGNYGMGAVHRSPDLSTTSGSSSSSSSSEGGCSSGGQGGGEAAMAGRGHAAESGSSDGLGVALARGGGAGGGRGVVVAAGAPPLRLLLTIDDVVGWGEECGCGRPHGEGEGAEAGAHLADASLTLAP